jgi:hypothetical protein
MTAISLGLRRPGALVRTASATGVLVALVVLVFFLTIRTRSPSLFFSAAMISMLAVAGWMFLSDNYPATLAVFLLYLGLLDGFIKLKTGLSYATLGRDVLLYSIVGGALARFTLGRRPIRLPPLSGWILAFVLVVLACAFNPGSDPFFRHALPSIRPHLEFVPLFFFGFLLLRSADRLRMFLILLLVCGAVNGVVNVIQFNMAPDQLASWGPGYSKFVHGEGALAGRVFSTASGDRVRPFGLAGDAGGGGVIAALAIPGAIALMGQAWRRPKYAAVALALSVGAITGVISSQGRGVVVGSSVMVFAYAALAVTPRRLVPTLAGIAVGGVVALFAINALSGNAGTGAFSRYESITPDKFLATTGQDRGGALSIVPKYIREYPLGHGLGTGGPATGFGGAAKKALSSESEFAFLVLEVGVIGLIVVVGFTIRLLALALTRVRRVTDPEVRSLLAATAAPLFGIAALYVGGPATSSSPLAPYLWFVAGVLAYWLMTPVTAARFPNTGRA